MTHSLFCFFCFFLIKSQCHVVAKRRGIKNPHNIKLDGDSCVRTTAEAPGEHFKHSLAVKNSRLLAADRASGLADPASHGYHRIQNNCVSFRLNTLLHWQRGGCEVDEVPTEFGANEHWEEKQRRPRTLLVLWFLLFSESD